MDQKHARDSVLIPFSLKEGNRNASNVKISKKRLKGWGIRENPDISTRPLAFHFQSIIFIVRGYSTVILYSVHTTVILPHVPGKFYLHHHVIKIPFSFGQVMLHCWKLEPTGSRTQGSH